jgi:hypothetical protein
LWQSVLLVKETGGPGENHRPVASHWQTCHSCFKTIIFLLRISSVMPHKDVKKWESPLSIHYHDSEPTCICFFSLMMCA